jgi:hypothetical protein
MLVEKCNNMSVSYARKLRGLANMLQLYPRFTLLSISFYEMDQKKARIKNMLAVPELHDHWSKTG